MHRARAWTHSEEVGDSAELDRRLGNPPGPGYQAHHIVPADEERAEALRNFRKKRRWLYINDVDNGVWLPTHDTLAAISAAS